MRFLTSLIAMTVVASAVPACATQPAAAPVGVSASAPAHAAKVQASAALQQRAEDLIRMINGDGKPAQFFSPRLLEKVPAARLSAIAGAVRRKHGRALGVAEINAETPNMGKVLITFERTQLPVTLGVEAAAPNLITGLMF